MENKGLPDTKCEVTCKTCENCARNTNTNGYGVCYAPKTKVCSDYVTEEQLEEEVQAFYNKLGTYTGD